MTSRDFCYWLQGYFEIAKAATMDVDAVEMVKKHLNMVFIHEIDPSHGDAKQQQKLNEAHGSVSVSSPFGPKFRC